MGPLRGRLSHAKGGPAQSARAALPRRFPALSLVPSRSDAYLSLKPNVTEKAMFKGLGAMGDMAKMMKAAKEMQEKMGELQEELKSIVVTGEAGAGLVQARATAKGELTGLSIDPSILQASEKEVVEDLILAAIKDTQEKAKFREQEEQKRLLRELGLPENMDLPV
tara:strand:+ start:426 stop:923 length:498 start_codon:yes stop_codon:yes gene_type:complete